MAPAPSSRDKASLVIVIGSALMAPLNHLRDADGKDGTGTSRTEVGLGGLLRTETGSGRCLNRTGQTHPRYRERLECTKR